MATTERDLYEVLGVERGASDAEIKRAYPQARPAVAPRRQHGPRGAGAVQGGQRGLPDPVRPGASPALRHVRAGGRRWRRRRAPGFEGFGGFSDIFDAFFGGAAGAGRPGAVARSPGSDLRYDLRITFEEAIKGTEKEIDFRVLDRCETCSGTGRRSPAPSRSPARSARAAARSAACARRCSARWSTSAPARAAGARARSSRHPARRASGDGPRRAQADPPRDDPGRASTRATRSG